MAEIIFPTSIKNVTTTDYFIYTPDVPFKSFSKPASGGVLITRDNWKENAKFPAGEYKKVDDILKVLKEGTRFEKPFESCKVNEQGQVELTFKENYGVSFTDRSILDILGFKGVPDKNRRGAYFVGNHKEFGKKTQPIVNDYPPDLTADTNMFFVNTNIIEQQHDAGVKSPFLRIIDSERRLSNGSLQVTSTTAHKVFTELQFKKLITSTSEEIQIELVTVTGQKVPFVGTGRVALTLKFKKF